MSINNIKGFSILELLLAMSILSLMLVLVVPSLYNQVNKTRYEVFLSHIETELANSRYQALLTKTNLTIKFIRKLEKENQENQESNQDIFHDNDYFNQILLKPKNNYGNSYQIEVAIIPSESQGFEINNSLIVNINTMAICEKTILLINFNGKQRKIEINDKCQII